MKSFTSPVSRFLCRTLCVVLANAAIPFGIPKLISDAWPKSKPVAAKPKPAPSRILSRKEMHSLQGKSGENPYLAGQSKWDPVFKGIDLMTGNYMTSATDLDFEGGFGIPVNVTRSYSANCADEGPFGKGWTLSADVRSTAGGLLKGPSAPVRSVPGNISDTPPQEYNPNEIAGNGHETTGTSGGAAATTSPVQGVTVTDAGGTAETVQKDVDGILTTPPWDDNVHNAVYAYVNFQGSVYQILYSDTTTTIDGTNYVYAAEGSYEFSSSGPVMPTLYTCGQLGGTLPYNAAQMTTPPAATPAFVLKVTSATDRQGNVTAYSYGATPVSFTKSDGFEYEYPLTHVSMPNGHQITFTWGTGAAGSPVNRIISACDGASPGTAARTVTYGYPSTGSYYNEVTSVTSPAGKTTNYSYSDPVVPTSWTSYGLAVAFSVLSQITDPRGLSTTIYSQMGTPTLQPYGVQLAGVVAYRVQDPNGVNTYIFGGASIWDMASILPGWDETLAPSQTAIFQFQPGSNAASYLINSGLLTSTVTTAVSNDPQLILSMQDGIYTPISTYSAVGDVRWTKTYDVPTQTLTVDDETTYPGAYNSNGQLNGTTLANPHVLQGPAWQQQDVVTTKTYNFMGNPLSSSVQEFQTAGGTQTQTRNTATTQYGYWNSSKYYQQRAVLDQAGRYSFTDYYPSTASAGSKGQTYQVYSPAFTTFTNGAGGGPDSNWKNDLTPSTSSPYSAQFTYDSYGRATTVYKLQTYSGGTATYVETATTYASNGSPAWGEASQVVEDYGGIGRTTTTNGYTADGKADDVSDAAGHEFVTSYDADGVVQSVTRTDVEPNVTLVSYTYGTSGITNGMPTAITDGLSGVSQSLSYVGFGTGGSVSGGIGQVYEVDETNGSDTYSCLYTYDAWGNRASAEYETPTQTSTWGYSDYNRVGTPENPKWAFQTLTQLNPSTGAPTAEAMHYLYDGQGRLEDAAFAQTPTATSIVSANGSWYDYTPGSSFYPASSRARTFYTYDPGGRVDNIDNWWDTFNTSSGTWNSSDYIVGNGCSYELTGAYNRGLKTGDAFYTQNTGTPTSSTTAWTQSYGYDNNLDYLTSATYGDGQPNSSQSWTYDAAGNRLSDYTGSGWTYDNLNRMTASPSMSYTSDILGNRTSLTPSGGGAGNYTWDCLNRLVGTTQPTPSPLAHSTAGVSYEYRADGMRVEKVKHSGTYEIGVGEVDDQYAHYRYDGQMPMETSIVKADGSTEVIDNGLGARGLDYVHIVTTPTSGSPTTTIGFPIYDAHGNQVATIQRSGSSYVLGNQRSYGAWGEVRQGATTGGPRGRYCGSLGHVQDDESGLVYMRARYYEATSGRFISEDPQEQGLNWFCYCENSPTAMVDVSGKFGETQTQNAVIMWFLGAVIDQLDAWGVPIPKGGGEATEIMISGALKSAAALEMASSLQAAAGPTMLVGMESGQPEIMAAGAGLYALAGLFDVIAACYIYQTAMMVDMAMMDTD